LTGVLSGGLFLTDALSYLSLAANAAKWKRMEIVHYALIS